MMSAIDLSSYLGLTAITLLTLNVLLGLVMSVKYNPVRAWPHRKVKTFQLHNWTGYLALAVSSAHAVILLFSSQEHFRVVDLLYPLGYEKQPLINGLGALALYLVVFIVTTSYFRQEIGRHRWKLLHYTTYAAAAVFFVHSILTDPTLKDKPVDYFDGEKVYIELLAALMLVAVGFRIRYRWVRHVPAVAVRMAREDLAG
ncbi:MAG TPA: ferric reductase-like transmembrane domain-containing protein [Gemmatimonadales bacterium]|nr:ferric reductase-like transmembrane domain-containing protein [Gemmatimonadales bacterium]